jgi:hypothetical protein
VSQVAAGADKSAKMTSKKWQNATNMASPLLDGGWLRKAVNPLLKLVCVA